MLSSLSSWFLNPVAKPQARLRLLCFPAAGAGASGYFAWARGLPEWVELCALQLPGREGRFSEEAYSRWEDLAEVLAKETAPLLDRPVVLFGHSMGALMAVHLASMLAQAGRGQLCKVILAGANAPSVPPRVRLSELTDAELIQAVVEMGGAPASVLEHPEFVQMMLTTLRVDAKLVESLRETVSPPVSCDLEVWFGHDDVRTRPADPLSWQPYTRGVLRSKEFPGDHFFIRDPKSGCLEHLNVQLNGLGIGIATTGTRILCAASGV